MSKKNTIESYRDLAPSGSVDLILKLAERLKDKTFLHVNSTRLGGGVAEMLLRLIPLFNDLDIDTRWEVMEGTSLFYQTTKSFHNALQGQSQSISSEMFNEYKKINQKMPGSYAWMLM